MRLALILYLVPIIFGQRPPDIVIHKGYISVQNAAVGGSPTSAPYTVGQGYTFELYMTAVDVYDYMIESCTMNGVQFIGPYGCVQCSSIVLQSIETEQYTVPGGVKRTLVHFIAPSSTIQFSCQVKVFSCTGCANRSCEKKPAFLGLNMQIYPVSCGAPVVRTYPVAPVFPVPVSRTCGYTIPWWLWLILGLLLLLLLLCCLACILASLAKKRKQRTTVVTRTANAAENRVVGIGTDDCGKKDQSVVTGGSLCQEAIARPAIAVIDTSDNSGTFRDIRETVVHERFNTFTPPPPAHYGTIGRSHDRRCDEGAYSVREGRRMDEGGRYDRRDHSASRYDVAGTFSDRASYRNYAYERDMGRVRPMSGFDQYETNERNYCMSDDDELVETDIKRTHTTRFVTETRQVDQDSISDAGSERLREEDHVVYTHTLPV